MPARRNNTGWEETQYLDNEKTNFSKSEAERGIAAEWDSNPVERGMDDQTVVVDDDKVTILKIC